MPFGEVFVEERNATWSTPYKFNGKEQDEETGLCYYGARYYDPRTSVWLSVDPLAEKYAGRSSYEYCLSNPVAYIDHDGRFSKKWMANLSRSWYNLTHKDNAGEIIENKDATKSQFKYTYQTGRKENGEFVVTSHYKFDKKGSQTMQNVGDGVAVVGYAATLSVVGAEVGVPLAAAGNAISLAGSVWELGIDVLNGDFGDSGKKVAFIIGGKLVEKGLNKVLPGAGKTIKQEGFNLGSEILKQGASLKVSGIERVVDAAVGKNIQNQK